MEVLKEIILTKNKRPILLQNDSRNENSVSKIHKNCKTNFSSNYTSKSNHFSNKNIKLTKKIKIPISINKANISLDRKSICKNLKDKGSDTSRDFPLLSYIDIEKYDKSKNNKSQEENKKNNNSNNKKQSNKNNYTFNKGFIINNNITNNISNNITNIILTNNNLKTKFFRNKNINLYKKKIFFYNNYNTTKNIRNINNNSNFLTQRKTSIEKNNKNNILHRNEKGMNFSLKNCEDKINIKNINQSLSNRNKIFSQKLLSMKDIKRKNIIERNDDKLNIKYFTSYLNCSSKSNINNKKLIAIKNNNKVINNSSKQLKKKENYNNQKYKTSNLKGKNIIKIKQSINNNKNTNNNKTNENIQYLRNSKLKLKGNNSLICKKKKYDEILKTSLKNAEDAVSLNSPNLKEKIFIQNLKKNHLTKNYNCYSSRDINKNIFGKNLKDKNINLTQTNKNNNFYNSNININDIKRFNQLKNIISKRYAEKSFSDKNNNSSFDTSTISTRGNFKNNLLNKKASYNNININQTYMGRNTKSEFKSKSKSNNKSYYYWNKKNIKFINENTNDKTERSSGNLNSKNNISNLNIILKRPNIGNTSKTSFIINYNHNLLNNKSFQNKKKRISMNINIHKNIKKEFFTKSLIKKVDSKNLGLNYKNNNYNSYKEQYLLNLVNSINKNSYVSHEKNIKNNNYIEKKNNFYNNQKKIYENKIYNNKQNNRCKKMNLDMSGININKNKLPNLISIKYPKNNNINKSSKEVINRIFFNKRRSPEYAIRNKQNLKKSYFSYDEKKIKKYELKINEVKEKKYDSIPSHLTKNILNIYFPKDISNFQENKINSARISPNISGNNNLIKNYNISKYKNKAQNLEKNKSVKLSMYHEFNIPYNNNISLNKKKNVKIPDELKNRQNNKNGKSEENKSIKIIEIKKDENNNKIKKFETFEVSEDEKNSKEEKEKDLMEEESQYLINENIQKNPQYLSEYLFDILENLLMEESYYIERDYINPDYLFSINNNEITPEIRLVSINWLIMILHKVFKFKESTLFLSVQLVDRFLTKKMLSLQKTELLLLTSLLIASKHEEIDYVNMNEALQLSSNKFTQHQITSMEYEILNELNFEIIAPNMSDYYNLFCTILNMTEIERNKGQYLLNIILIDFNMLEYSNFILALAVVKLIIKKSVKSLIKIISDLLIKNNENICLNMLKNEDIVDVVCKKIKKLFQKFINCKYKNIQEKFSEEKFCSVSDLFIDLI